MAGSYAEVVILAAWEQQLLTSVQRTDCTSFSRELSCCPQGIKTGWLAFKCGAYVWRESASSWVYSTAFIGPSH